MKNEQAKPLGELALQIQELRRRNPKAYWYLAKIAGMPEARVKAIAHGAEPTVSEEIILKSLARG